MNIQGIRILVVEDETIVALDMESRLSSLGFMVVGLASTGARAIQLVEDQLPDVVLMDIKLKGPMDGIEAADTIRKRFDIPIIYITAFADELTLSRAKVTEAFAYILKPFNEREVVIAIQISIYKARMEREIKQSRELLDCILNSIADGVAATDLLGNLKFVNRSAARLFGSDATNCGGKNLEDLANMPVKLKYPENAYLLTRGDGTRIPIERFDYPISGKNASTHGTVHVFRDITERVRMNEMQTRYSSIVRTTSDAVLTVSPQLEIVSWNEGAERMYGYKASEVIGKPFSSLYPEAADYGTIPDLSGNIGEKEGLIFEALRICADGKIKTVSVSMAPISVEDGVASEYSVIERDITERREYELSLQRAKVLAEEAARAKGEFLSNVSHELRTPLNSIIGMTELAIDKGATSEQREYLQIALQSAGALLSLINSILDFSKIEAGRMVLHPSPFSLSETVESCLENLCVQAHKKGLALYYVMDETIPDGIIGDQFRINQILVNLVNNAIKFTERGYVGIELGIVGKIEALKTKLRIVIKDSGIGIQADRLEHIFEKFTQIDGSSKRAYGGTGLGLSITRGLCQLMGGEITVESVPGAGSSFIVEIPCGIEISIDSRVKLRNSRQGIGCYVHVTQKVERESLIQKLDYLGTRPRVVESMADAIVLLRADIARGKPSFLLSDDSANDIPELLIELNTAEDSQSLAEKTILFSLVLSKAEVAWKTLFEGLSFLVKPPKLKGLYDALNPKKSNTAKERVKAEKKPPRPKEQGDTEARPQENRDYLRELNPTDLQDQDTRAIIEDFLKEAGVAMEQKNWELLEGRAQETKRALEDMGRANVAKFMFALILLIRKGSFEKAVHGVESVREALFARREE